MRKRHQIRRHETNTNEGGQDSFLDIVSNIVGILIILVMIAGTQVGTIQTAVELCEKDAVDSTLPANTIDSTLVDVAKKEENKLSPIIDPDKARDYLQLGQKVIQVKQAIAKTQQDVNQLNSQALLVQQQSEGAEAEHASLLSAIAKAEAMLEIERQKKTTPDQAATQLEQQIREMLSEQESLEQLKNQLLVRKPKSTQLENIPTPMTKKVEGHEAFFCLKNGRISHVPMNVFTERLRGSFRNFRDAQKNLIDETIGPVDQYSFHYQASIHQVRHADGVGMSIVFDYGECIPENNLVGEPITNALIIGSEFEKKLRLYLQDNSTITLFVYPDSFSELRTVKKYLLDREYTIALRPMPFDQYITISPQGSSSTTY